MSHYTPPYTITSKILKLSTQIDLMLEMILKSIQNMLQSDQKSNYKSDQKVLVLMRENNKITINELMDKLSMSESGIKKVIKKLKDEGSVIRRGGLKSGYWEVME